MKNTSVLIWLLILVCSCSKTTDNPTAAREAAVYRDVSYGVDPQQKADIYLPANRTSVTTRVLVLVHGGAWAGGDKTEFDPFINNYLLKELPDYAIINVNYRLYKEGANQFPTQEKDVKAACDFLNSKRKEYAVSEKTALLGTSAGGHLALLTAYKNNQSGTIRAVISIAGPTDLTALYDSNTVVANTLLVPVIGGTPAQVPDLYIQNSPISFAGTGAAPTLLFQGGKDPLVPQSQAELLINRLQQLNVPFQKVIYPDAGHGWGEPELTDTFNKCRDFLKQHLQ
ncbi:alpha/beta hydrolase [Niabella drilacis]|uniref:Acetyl esterase/lipase n=1 Tax=Niabella drilacis (strain DSM 25811 / CCM 8410 / CCUG 62505 / LMG 26954 / E90) TaxID=1285928 RepID=A0A1G6I6H1_NIADE|nr:alpha/beta hydrolase [Niabella drilacis]SDC01635.1 Acetyl esterase/lipase [Niabella drilacis]